MKNVMSQGESEDDKSRFVVSKVVQKVKKRNEKDSKEERKKRAGRNQTGEEEGPVAAQRNPWSKVGFLRM